MVACVSRSAVAGRMLLAALVVLAGVAPAAFADTGLAEPGWAPTPADTIQLQSGQISGKRLASGVRAYLGIPFAMPPVQQLRWREPQPAHAWQGILHADHFAPECIQPLRADDLNQYFGELASREDCLYLNVWAPPQATARSHLPVVVWLHGGGFKVGSANAPSYNGESLAGRGVIYVSIAYRLGVLGLLAHPWLTAESVHHASGNFAFLDQIAALQWIQSNIKQFGGDPHRVTVMGQSAGAMSVSILQASPLAAGLFQHAVGMSGGSIDLITAGKAQPLREAEQAGVKLQQALGVTDVAALRSLPASRILQAQMSLRADYGAVIDCYLLPGAPAQLFSSGRQNDVSLLLGFTRDESFSDMSRAKNLAEYRDYALKLYGDRAPAFMKLYPAADDARARRAALDAGRDSSLGVEMRTWARAQVTTGKAPVYVYMFSRVHPYVPGIQLSGGDPRAIGAYHTGDIPYWLGTLDSMNALRHTRDWTPLDRQLSQQMLDVIVSFAQTGYPGRIGSVEWPRYERRGERVVELGDSIRIIDWPDEDRLDFFALPAPVASYNCPTSWK
jgi:para-nitrobenzyl esterase